MTVSLNNLSRQLKYIFYIILTRAAYVGFRDELTIAFNDLPS